MAHKYSNKYQDKYNLCRCLPYCHRLHSKSGPQAAPLQCPRKLHISGETSQVTTYWVRSHYQTAGNTDLHKQVSVPQWASASYWQHNRMAPPSAGYSLKRSGYPLNMKIHTKSINGKTKNIFCFWTSQLCGTLSSILNIINLYAGAQNLTRVQPAGFQSFLLTLPPVPHSFLAKYTFMLPSAAIRSCSTVLEEQHGSVNFCITQSPWVAQCRYLVI